MSSERPNPRSNRSMAPIQSLYWLHLDQFTSKRHCLLRNAGCLANPPANSEILPRNIDSMAFNAFEFSHLIAAVAQEQFLLVPSRRAQFFGLTHRDRFTAFPLFPRGPC